MITLFPTKYSTFLYIPHHSLHYHTSHLLSGFIFEFNLHLKLFANSLELDSGPITLKIYQENLMGHAFIRKFKVFFIYIKVLNVIICSIIVHILGSTLCSFIDLRGQSDTLSFLVLTFIIYLVYCNPKQVSTTTLV